jgi:hypothetical protein
VEPVLAGPRFLERTRVGWKPVGGAIVEVELDAVYGVNASNGADELLLLHKLIGRREHGNTDQNALAKDEPGAVFVDDDAAVVAAWMEATARPLL